MTLGAENRVKLVLACLLLAVAIILLVRMFGSGGQPAAAAQKGPVAEPVRFAGARAGRARPGSRSAADPSLATLDPRLRLDLLKQSEETDYKGAGRNIFRAEAEPVIPKPVASASKQTPPAVPPPVVNPGPPPPPPINLKFFGFANSPDEPAKVFLSQGDNIFVAGEGDIVNRRYKILHIGPKSVDIEDVLSNNRQTIPLTAQGG